MARKTITITLYMSEVVYDIQNKTYLTGESRKTGDNFEQVAQMKANSDDENLNQILRSIGTAFSSLRGLLGEYLDGSTANLTNKLTSSSQNLTLELSVPSNYNDAVTDALTAALHTYIVSNAVGDWFTITNKADAAEYYQAAASAITEIRNAINKRTRPKRTAI